MKYQFSDVVDISDLQKILVASSEEELYRIAQEGLNNVVKHAAAKHVRIQIQYEAHSVSLEMIDDGLGFDRQTVAQSGGFGLQGIRERVKRLGGSQEIESAPRKGTRLKVKVPVP